MSDHTGEEYKGRAKEALGDLTDDDEMKREGKIDKGSAQVKDKVSDVADKAKNANKDR